MKNKEPSYGMEIALQHKYANALIKARPGLGSQSLRIAEDIINTGLTPNEAVLLIDLVYSSKDMQGRGQTTRLKHFSEAVINRYGGDYLEKVGRSPSLFKGLLYQIGQAVETRDEINGSLAHSSVSFKDSLLFQELGLSAELLDSYVYHLTSEKGLSEVAAIMRIKEAAAEVEKGRFATLEGILFREEFDDLTNLTMQESD